MEKPNFERIASLWYAETYANFDLDTWVKKFNKDWESDLGKISYPDNPMLESFLEEYSMLGILSDFQFIAFTFLKWNQTKEQIKKTHSRFDGYSLELLQVLKLLSEHEQGLTITFKHSKFKVQAEIKNEVLIGVVKQDLYNYFMESDWDMETRDSPEKDITNWGEYFDKRIKAVKPKAGRKKGNHSLRRCVYYLWKYLQEFTDLKAIEGTGYSNSQARFIFRFLCIHGLIENPELISNEEDYIGNHLKAYRKNRKIFNHSQL